MRVVYENDTWEFRGEKFPYMHIAFRDDEHEEQLVKQRLYVTDTNEQVYHIVRSTQTEKSHHAYRFSVNGDTCVINNGKDTISLQFDMLMELVKSLTGISENEVPTLAEIDEQERKISNG